MPGTEPLWGPTKTTSDNPPYVNRDGFDLVWLQASLQTQMVNIETDIKNIQQNANLSDTEKMFSVQMAMNSWSTVSMLRTATLKSVYTTLQAIVRNVE